MNKKIRVAVVGLGEVGRPILELLSQQHEVIGVDVAPPVERIEQVDILHICYPFEVDDFIRRPDWFRLMIIVINLLIVLYMLYLRFEAEEKRRAAHKRAARQ